MRFVLAATWFAMVCAVAIASPQDPAKRGESPIPGPTAKAAARPHIPDEFTNLQVLPKNITKPRLMNVMKRFSVTFGVRCSYCHTVSDDLTEGKFDSDDKEPKLKARELLKAIYETKPDTSKETPKFAP